MLSEYPPGTAPQRFQLLARNRIMSGLAHGVMESEAEIKSGSQLLANYACQHNREVLSLPNRLCDVLGAGTNALIQAGAAMFTGPETLVENLHFYP